METKEIKVGDKCFIYGKEMYIHTIDKDQIIAKTKDEKEIIVTSKENIERSK